MKVIEASLPILKLVANETERGIYVSQLAGRLKIPDTEIVAALKRSLKQKRRGSPDKAAPRKKHTDMLPADEIKIFSFMLAAPELVEKELLEEIESSAESESARKIAKGIWSQIKEQGSFKVSGVDSYLDKESAEIVTSIAMKVAEMPESYVDQKVLADSIHSLKEKGIKKARLVIDEKIKKAEKNNDTDLLLKLIKEKEQNERRKLRLKENS